MTGVFECWEIREGSRLAMLWFIIMLWFVILPILLSGDDLPNLDFAGLLSILYEKRAL